ncbi:MAG: hemerythrin family protein [Gammaproteobacteria bacterium]|nr:hemerythrin family protein [Gammaproteobacteria bacterium]
MELIKWSDQFATGISGVDHEHEALIESINSFCLNLEQDSAKDELINSLNNIYATIHSHFMLEEKVMKKNAYDEYQQHRDEHAELLDDIRDLIIELESSLDFNPQKFSQKLTIWFLTHFKTHDARLHKLGY